MATLYEYYNTGDDCDRDAYATLAWIGQTFTPTTTHRVTSVKALLRRSTGNPGTVTLEIYATSAGIPVGAVLCSGTTNGNTLSSTVPEWREITLGAGAVLTKDVMYAWTVRCEGDTSANRLVTRADGTSPTYTRGTQIQAVPGSSANWVTIASVDEMFEVWGEPLAVVGSKSAYMAAKMVAARAI